MGRKNRSRKRSDEMNRVKKERYAKKELLRLKKTLGLIDANGDEIMKEISEVATVKTAKEIKASKLSKEEQEYLEELQEIQDKGENITVVNEKTGKQHSYNTKTFKDENGSYPPWYKPKKTAKKVRKLNHARVQRFNQCWSTTYVPL